MSQCFNNRPKPIKLNSLPEHQDDARGRFPSWLHKKLPQGKVLFETNQILKDSGLSTVCEEAKCPNRLECYSNKTATFLALGDHCTRACGFCDIAFSKQPKAPDPQEPIRIANTIKKLQLRHAVITMVARDDLPDQGSLHIKNIVDTIRSTVPLVTIELLTSDFSGRQDLLDHILEARPDIFNHNIETVESLTPKVRHKATYQRTLDTLKYMHQQRNIPFIKSGIMVGLGETVDEVKATLNDLLEAGCDIITIGQYLQANRHKLRVKAFIHPQIFKELEKYGIDIGVPHMYAGPFVRSSYNASLLKDAAFQGVKHNA